MARTISERAMKMPPSPIRKLAPYAEKAKAEGVHVYHLNIGQPDLPPPAEFWQGIHDFGEGIVAYSLSGGIPALRNKVANKYADYGIHVTPEQVLVTTAGSEALAIAIATVCDKGDEVIVPEPMYANYIGFAATSGVKVVGLPTKIEENFALPSTSEFESKITPHTKAIIICNPNNPTGTIYSEAQIKELINLANNHDLYLIFDEVYREFVYEGNCPKSILTYEGTDECAMMVDSVSKRFSLCGARIGFLVTKNQAILDSAIRFAQARLSSPTLEMHGVLGCLDTPQSYFDDIRIEYKKRRDTLVNRLRKMEGVLCPEIQGAFYATVKLPIDDGDKFAQWLLESFRYNNSTLMVAPASGFYSEPGLGKDEVRIAYVLNSDDLNKAMDCLEEALTKYPGSKIKEASSV